MPCSVLPRVFRLTAAAAAMVILATCSGCTRIRGVGPGTNTVGPPGTMALTSQKDGDSHFITYVHAAPEDVSLSSDREWTVIKGSCRLRGGDTLNLEYKPGSNTLRLGECEYNLDEGQVFLCQSSAAVEQLPIQLHSNIYLSRESVRLARQTDRIKQFVESVVP